MARAALKAEVADAAWDIDRAWSKKLLKKAYELTWPIEDEQTKLRSTGVGAQPTFPKQSDRARRLIRNRIVEVAAKEKSFADELIQSGVKILGPVEGQMTYATLAENAARRNDLESAGKYVTQSVDIDPSQLGAGYVIAECAKRPYKSR